MLPILLVSVTPYVGKNVVALGIAEKFRREGKSVGFFKPIGPLPMLVDGRVVDEDAVFFRKVLGLSEPLEDICPLVLSDQALADALRGAQGDAAPADPRRLQDRLAGQGHRDGRQHGPAFLRADFRLLDGQIRRGHQGPRDRRGALQVADRDARRHPAHARAAPGPVRRRRVQPRARLEGQPDRAGGQAVPPGAGRGRARLRAGRHDPQRRPGLGAGRRRSTARCSARATSSTSSPSISASAR